jgi:hypothetical protein
MGCTFCATGQMGFARHLTSSEIFEQASIFHAELKKNGERLSNVVLMGMGEPLANYDNGNNLCFFIHMFNTQTQTRRPYIFVSCLVTFEKLILHFVIFALPPPPPASFFFDTSSFSQHIYSNSHVANNKIK